MNELQTRYGSFQPIYRSSSTFSGGSTDLLKHLFGHVKMKIFTIIGIILLAGCGPIMTPTERVVSPGGDFVIAAIPNDSKSDPTKYRCIRLILEHRNGNVLSAIQTNASDGQKWAVGWIDSGDVIVLQSSDIGTQAYEVTSNELSQIQVTPAIQVRAEELKKAKYGN